MVTQLALTLLQFSAVVTALAVLARLVSRPGTEPRRAAARVAVLFGVVALAAGYVWLGLGPEVDLRLRHRHDPLALRPPPHELEA